MPHVLEEMHIGLLRVTQPRVEIKETRPTDMKFWGLVGTHYD